MVLQGDLQVPGLDAGQFGPYIQMVVVFGDVHQGINPDPPRTPFPAISILEEAVHAALKLFQFPQGIPPRFPKKIGMLIFLRNMIRFSRLFSD